MEEAGEDSYWKLRLYISKESEDSIQALATLNEICKRYIPQGYSIEVIDVGARPDLSGGDEVVLTPTLLKLLPLPEKRLSGTLEDTELVLAVLGVGPYKM